MSLIAAATEDDNDDDEEKKDVKLKFKNRTTQSPMASKTIN